MKMRLMTYLWRLQQSQMIVSMILWATLLTITSYEYVGWRLQQTFFDNIYIGFSMLFLMIFGIILFIGFAFDAILKLWREQAVVATIRNPYCKEKLTAKEVVMWRHMFLPVLGSIKGRDPKVEKDVATMDKWVGKSIAEDADLRKEVEDLESWIEK